MRVYVVGHAPVGEDAATGGFDWFFTPEQAISNARRTLREIGGLGAHSITYVPLDVPDDVAHPDRQTPVDNDSITRWIDARLELVEVDAISVAGREDPTKERFAERLGDWIGEPRQTRPSAILRRPDPETPVSDLTTAELLREALDRTEARRLAAAVTPVSELVEREGRAPILGYEHDLERAGDAIQDAISLHNRAVYRERGVFAITDAERIPGAGAVVAPPLAVVAFSRAEATSYIVHASHEEPIEIVTRREDVLGKRFRDAVYVPGWDRDLSSSASDEIRGAVSVCLRSADG